MRQLYLAGLTVFTVVHPAGAQVSSTGPKEPATSAVSVSTPTAGASAPLVFSGRANQNAALPVRVADPGTIRIDNIRVDWLFSWQPHPGTVFYVGYGSSLAEDRPFRFSELQRVNDGFFTKFSYLFRM